MASNTYSIEIDPTKEITPNISDYNIEERFKGIFALSIKILNVLFLSDGFSYANFFDAGADIGNHLFDINDISKKIEIQGEINSKLKENFPDFDFDITLDIEYTNTAKTESILKLNVNLEPNNNIISSIYYDIENIPVQFLIKENTGKINSVEIKF
jgi:hypothetical protein